ncbi:sigma-70 family RNA polymerase sigma factor [Streptomyces sp. A7024]|uniref:Sigma-70 family RNA polymerase sigma factor n=1 Tax=Streptomyces coryli TaxID=1128680 RepID=A0A6G4TV62_9ACTN|nr:sigma-70 family RNA polymerase sigma factor [Streptomyces coryli]NGN63774.1 sigma-70 family RNA polymerase sigma factor [Streptomyces coryli]
MTLPADAFATEVAPQLPTLRRHALVLTRGHQADADDLVQETLLRAYCAFPRYVPGNLGGWLYRILRNAHFGEYQRRQRRPAVPSDFAPGSPGAPGSGVGGGRTAGPGTATVRSAEEEALAGMLDQPLREAFAALRPEFRRTAYLAFVEGRSYSEIAEATGVPRGTVMSRLHRARRRLRAEVAGHTAG